MKKLWFLTVVAAFILVVGGSVAPVFAGAAKELTPEQRIANQQSRIDQALKANEITPDDAKMLQGGLDKIKEEMTRMKADGQLSKAETDKLDSMLVQHSQLINKTREAKKKAAAPAKPAATAAPAAPKVVTPAAQDPAISKAIADQQNKINQGIQSKQLTVGEAKALEENLTHIREEDTRLRADGNFTQADKDQLQKLLAQNSEMIRDKKTNPVKTLRKTIDLKDRKRTIPERFVLQQDRIDQGVKSKALTQEEKKILQDNLNYIKNEEARLRQGGKLSDQEKERLHILLDSNSDMIENKKNNPVKAVK